jgi:Na+(H+)/acetate symporter ActP
MNQELLGGGVRGFRVAAAASALVPLGAALVAGPQALAGSVGLVFAFTASTICPLLVLGVWWRRLTAAGAVAGLAVGALTCGGAVLAAGFVRHPIAAALLGQPAAWSVPLAFAVMVGVSLASRRPVQTSTDRFLVRIHRPEPRELAAPVRGSR